MGVFELSIAHIIHHKKSDTIYCNYCLRVNKKEFKEIEVISLRNLIASQKILIYVALEVIQTFDVPHAQLQS